MRGYGVFTLESDLTQLFQRMDKKQVGLIKFKDFASEMLPMEMCDQVKEMEIMPAKRYTKR